MPLAYPKLSLPDAAETVAFRVICNLLQSDPTLRRIVRGWNTWTGDPTDIVGPRFAWCPYLQLSPMPSPSAWESEGQHRMPLIIAIQAAVAGSNVDQLMNFWGSIRSALWPVDPARFAIVRETVQNARVTRPMLTQSAYGCKLEENGVRLLIADGQLQLTLLIDTP